jgi:hypothetical protein
MKSDKFLAVLRQNNKKRAHLILTETTMQQIHDYHAQGYTKGDMCKLLSVGMSVMNRCFRAMGLHGRGGARSKLTPHRIQVENTALFRAQQLEPLIRSSFLQGLSSVDVGRLCGCDYSTIIDYARLLGISIQTRSQAASKRYGSLAMQGELLEILDGELLGDGCLVKPKTSSALFCYGTSRGPYIAWLADLLCLHGLEGKAYGPRCNTGSFGKISFDYHSKRYPELYDLYQRWYPNGKKAVPRDLRLTPTVCRHWYIGDGTFKQLKPWHAPSLSIATMGFTREDVEYLQYLLEPHIPQTHLGKHPNGPTLTFPKVAAAAFLEYI